MTIILIAVFTAVNFGAYRLGRCTLKQAAERSFFMAAATIVCAIVF